MVVARVSFGEVRWTSVKAVVPIALQDLRCSVCSYLPAERTECGSPLPHCTKIITHVFHDYGRWVVCIENRFTVRQNAPFRSCANGISDLKES